MAITIRNITDEQIEMAKNISGKGTASAGVVACVDIAARSLERCIAQDAKIAELREDLAQRERVMSRLAASCDEALTIIRQKELLQ